MVELLILAFGVSMDAAAVAAAHSVATGRERRFSIVKLAAVFGAFQSAMALAGWVGGVGLNRIVAAWDHWIAFALLTFVGIRMIISSGKDEKKTPPVLSNTALLLLGLATSVDSFAVGLTLPILTVAPLPAVAVIGAVTFIICMISGWIGQRLGTSFGRKASVAGGVILIGIGTHILISHLSG